MRRGEDAKLDAPKAGEGVVAIRGGQQARGEYLFASNEGLIRATNGSWYSIIFYLSHVFVRRTSVMSAGQALFAVPLHRTL